MEGVERLKDARKSFERAAARALEVAERFAGDADALRRLIDQPDERARLGAALQQWVQRHYALRGLQQRWFDALFAASPTHPQDNA